MMISSLPPSPAKHPPLPRLPSPVPSLTSGKNIADRLVISHIDAGNLRSAVSSLDVMARRGTHPDPVTYSLLLKSCIRSRDFRLGKLVHTRLRESGLEPDRVLYNSLISLYSKCGDWEEAKAVFESMGESKRDVVSWSAIVSCFANNGMESAAINMFIEMLKLGIKPNEYCYSAMLRACSNYHYISIGRVVFGHLLKTGYFNSHVSVGCSLIDMFVKGERDLENALEVFDEMTEKNVVSWTLMITRCTQMGFPGEAVGLFLDMVLDNYVPDKFTLSAVISACAELGKLFLGQQLHSWAVRTRLASDVCVGCSLVDMYAKCNSDGSIDDSRKVFDRMPDHNVMSWTAIITGCVQNGNRDKEAIELFSEMITQGQILPNHFTFSSVLKACGGISDPLVGEQVYGHVVKRALASDNCVGNSLISMFAKTDRLEDARKAFESLFEKNLVSYNTMVDGYSRNSNAEEAFELYQEIVGREMGLSAYTYASLLSGAASVGAISKGEQIHAQTLKQGFRTNLPICNALISMYSKCGNIDAANKIFKQMEDRNLISWTSIITGFAKHGLAERVLESFDDMLKEGLKPNEVTYIAILSACSHVGLVSEGRRYFETMHREHGIVPRMEHYACMVDLLGRSGFLTQAIDVIDSMPFKADICVWRTFLGACRVHGEVKLGKLAANKILEQDPDDLAAYVLLSNLYAAAGKWDDVSEIRKQMKERNLVKEAGCSWIEVENRIHRFYVGDTSHPRAREIYEELGQLVKKIKRLGYVPNTDLVLHKLDDQEQKEHFLLQHSEKIAVAFGLISTTGESKPIRVFKNLRVCGDCHNAIKYISEVTGREIVLRDSNRFHHMKNGRCSCKEYW